MTFRVLRAAAARRWSRADGARRLSTAMPKVSSACASFSGRRVRTYGSGRRELDVRVVRHRRTGLGHNLAVHADLSGQDYRASAFARRDESPLHPTACRQLDFGLAMQARSGESVASRNHPVGDRVRASCRRAPRQRACMRAARAGCAASAFARPGRTGRCGRLRSRFLAGGSCRARIALHVEDVVDNLMREGHFPRARAGQTSGRPRLAWRSRLSTTSSTSRAMPRRSARPPAKTPRATSRPTLPVRAGPARALAAEPALSARMRAR